MSDIRILTSQHRGWERCWQLIEQKYGSMKCINLTNGYAWEYHNTQGETHQFRHLDLPYCAAIKSGKRRGPATCNITTMPDDFEPAQPANNATPTHQHKVVIPDSIPFDFDAYNRGEMIGGSR